MANGLFKNPPAAAGAKKQSPPETKRRCTTPRITAVDVLYWIGAGFVSSGIWAMNAPAGFIAAGIFFVVAAALVSNGGDSA